MTTLCVVTYKIGAIIIGLLMHLSILCGLHITRLVTSRLFFFSLGVIIDVVYFSRAQNTEHLKMKYQTPVFELLQK